MQLKNFNVYFFFLILAAVSVVTFLIFKPFLMAILIAAVLSVIFHSPFEYISKKIGNRKRWGGLITSFYAFLIFVIPIFIILGLIISESASLYEKVSAGEVPLVDSFIAYFEASTFFAALGLTDLVSAESLIKSFSQAGQSALTIVQRTYSGVFQFFLLSFVMFFTLYYFLVNGKSLMKRIKFLSPLRDKHENLLIEKFTSISRATIKGTLVVALIQGLIGGLSFAIAGLPSVIIWTVLMVFLSLIPMFGSGIVWFPVGVFLILAGSVWQGVFILLVGIFIISLVDNILKPKLVGKDTQMHPLVVFFATLGGIGLFGFPGFLIGPIVVALFISLWEIYAVEFKRQLSGFNGKG